MDIVCLPPIASVSSTQSIWSRSDLCTRPDTIDIQRQETADKNKQRAALASHADPDFAAAAENDEQNAHTPSAARQAAAVYAIDEPGGTQTA